MPACQAPSQHQGIQHQVTHPDVPADLTTSRPRSADMGIVARVSPDVLGIDHLGRAQRLAPAGIHSGTPSRAHCTGADVCTAQRVVKVVRDNGFRVTTPDDTSFTTLSCRGRPAGRSVRATSMHSLGFTGPVASWQIGPLIGPDPF